MGITWENLKGKKSCHTGVGRTAGWNIPMGLIHKQTNDCDFSERVFFVVVVFLQEYETSANTRCAQLCVPS